MIHIPQLMLILEIEPTKELSLDILGKKVDKNQCWAMIQEDQTRGQAIRKYSVEALVGGDYVPVSSGTSVGNKKIDLLQGSELVRRSLKMIFF